MPLLGQSDTVAALGVSVFGGGFAWFWTFVIAFCYPANSLTVLACAGVTVFVGIPLITAISAGMRATMLSASLGYAVPYLGWTFVSQQTNSIWLWLFLSATAFACGVLGELLGRTIRSDRE